MSKPLFLIKNIFEQELFPVIHSMYLAYRSDNGNDMSSFESEIRDVLNKIVEERSCVGVTSTFNPDKPCFGVYVNPTILDEDLVRIVFDKEEVSLTRYAVEIDLKMFDYLNPEDIAAILIEEITTVMSCNTINTVRALLETIMTDRDISINFRQSVNFNQLLIFGIKDTIRKVASVMYKPADEDGVNEYAAEFGYSGVIADMIGKLHTAIFDASGINVNPKLSVLSWVLTVYNDPNTNYSMTLDDLKTAALMTGSKLEKDEIGKTITSLTKAANEFLTESALLFEGSLFKNLKQSGLRSIEDDLYEYKIRVKTCETEDDAMYILHQISTRINILEDYLYNTPGLTEMEYQRWTNVINAYKELRIMLGKKPIVDKKRYGIFVDYDYLDTLDKPTRESADIQDNLTEGFFSNLKKKREEKERMKKEAALTAELEDIEEMYNKYLKYIANPYTLGDGYDHDIIVIARLLKYPIEKLIASMKKSSRMKSLKYSEIFKYYFEDGSNINPRQFECNSESDTFKEVISNDDYAIFFNPNPKYGSYFIKPIVEDGKPAVEKTKNLYLFDEYKEPFSFSLEAWKIFKKNNNL